MRRIALATGLACCLLPAALHGQVTVGVALGMVGSSTIVRDSIVEAIAVRPRLAPQLGVRVTSPLSARYQVAAEVTVSHSSLMVHGDSSTRVTGLTLWSPTVGIAAAATRWLTAEARLGALLYDPGETDGTLFSDGSPVTPTIGLGLRAERALGRGMFGAVQVQWDLHRFTTNALKARGFTGKTVVHRVAMRVVLHRGLGRAAPRD